MATKDESKDTKSETKPAAEGKPAGDGGASPKSRPDHQDIWPPNPEPSESAQAKAKENAELDKELHG